MNKTKVSVMQVSIKENSMGMFTEWATTNILKIYIRNCTEMEK